MAIETQICSQKNPDTHMTRFPSNINPVLGFSNDVGFDVQLFQQLYHSQCVQNLGFDDTGASYVSHPYISMDTGYPQFMASQLEKQNQEFDQFLHLQNKRFRFCLQRKRNQESGIILQRLESQARSMIMQKDRDLENTRTKAKDLEDSLKRVEMENEAWRKLAIDSESKIIDLKTRLHQMKKNQNHASFMSDSQSSSSDHCKSSSSNISKVICKLCNRSCASVILFPCRHLCSCRDCDTVLKICPVCSCLKTASIEASMGGL